MGDHVILGIHVTDRVTKACEVQKIFTKYGCNIKTRLGLHEISKDDCSSTGVILLELCSDTEMTNEMVKELESVEGIETQRMVFTHPQRKCC